MKRSSEIALTRVAELRRDINESCVGAPKQIAGDLRASSVDYVREVRLFTGQASLHRAHARADDVTGLLDSQPTIAGIGVDHLPKRAGKRLFGSR